MSGVDSASKYATNMAGHHSWNGKVIDELPAEILSFSIKDMSRSTLKEIAVRLNKDSISGNWETLAEKLGFTQSSVLDTLIERARVQNTYPGLLMLQDWACRSGSTAFVLLHALREIQREDVLSIVVQKLFELNSLQLSVSVEDRTGVLQFLRVGTRKSAPLHATLDNILQHPLYWYDIVGPRPHIDWNTPSGELQGVQLTLKLRPEPNQHSLEQIYGTSMRLCQPPSQPHQDYQPPVGMQIDGGQAEGQRFVNQLELNIPPTEPAVSVTLGPSQFNVKTQGPVRLAGNNLSGGANDPYTIQPTIQHNLNISRGDAFSRLLPPPPVCRPRSGSPQNMGLQDMVQGPESVLNGMQPMTECHQALPNLSDFNTGFPNLTSECSRNDEFTVSVSCGGAGVGAGAGPSHTFPMELRLSSLTNAKQPVTGHQGGRFAREDDESVLRQQGAARPHDLGGQNVMVRGERGEGFQGLESPDKDPAVPTCTSFLHHDYVSHKSLIEFCNNPTSPFSAGSNSSSPSTPQAHHPPAVTASSSSSAGQPADALSHFLGSSQVFRGAGSQPQGCKNWQHSGYVPHSFIEHMSQNFHRSASAPNLEGDDLMEAEEAAAELVAAHSDEGMDFSEAQGSHAGRPSSDTLSSSLPLEGTSKPPMCGYSQYRPGLMHHHYQNCRPDSSKPLLHSVSMEAGDGGYVDMTGSRQDSGHSSSMDDPRLRPSASFDGYMNDSVSRFARAEADGAQSLDAGVLRRSDDGMDNMRHPRNRRPLPPSSGDMFQPRNRHPVTQDHDMLLSDESSAEYTYIDPQPLRGDSSDCDSRESTSSTPRPARRSSGGNVSGGKQDRKRSYHRELSDSELQLVPGWNANVTDKTVEQEMQKYINDDGNFIVWRYAVGGKYVISVSHLRSIRHYAVYETAKEGKVYYYIFPKGCARFTSLSELVKHCMTQGVSEPTKTFRSPDGRETQRGSGRFSHVRLKTPIPPRRRN